MLSNEGIIVNVQSSELEALNENPIHLDKRVP